MTRCALGLLIDRSASLRGASSQSVHWLIHVCAVHSKVPMRVTTATNYLAFAGKIQCSECKPLELMWSWILLAFGHTTLLGSSLVHRQCCPRFPAPSPGLHSPNVRCSRWEMAHEKYPELALGWVDKTFSPC